MKSRIIAILLLAVMTVTLVACTDPFAEDLPLQEQVDIATAQTGRLVVGKSSYILIEDKQLSPISMSVEGSADEFFSGYETGDKIEVTLSLVAESYPGQAEVYSIKLVEKGSVSDIPTQVMSELREMGWVE